MDDGELKKGELVFCKGSSRIGVIVEFKFVDWQGCNLWELTDGAGKYWLCPEYLIFRFPDNWEDISEKAKVAYSSIKVI
jgi:hypothetical protein